MLAIPRPLETGDVVRVVAPSGCFDREVFATGASLLESAGFRLRFDDGIFSRRGYLAGDDGRRLAELEQAVGDPEARAVWMARGGYGATRLLPSLAPAAVAASRRWLVGFSDATALHALWSRAGLCSVHGANVTTLASWSEAARTELFGLLTAPGPREYAGAVVRPGRGARGPLWGGNLTVLAAMAGTRTLPAHAGAILFVEDVGEKPYRLDRAVTQLRQAGVLASVAAIVVGQLTDCVDGNGPPGAGESALSALEHPRGGPTALGAIVSALDGLDVPVLAGLPLGHEASSRAILLGADARVDVERGVLTVGER